MYSTVPSETRKVSSEKHYRLQLSRNTVTVERYALKRVFYKLN